MENKKIAKKSLLYFIGNFSSKIMTSLLVPLYAYFISAEALGIYDYSQTIMNILIPVVFVSIWEAIIRFILGDKDDIDKEKKLATSAIFTVSMCGAFAIGAIIINFLTEIDYLLFFITMVVSTALAQIWQYYSRSLEKNKLYVFTSIVSTFVNLSLNILLIVFLKMEIEALYISYIIAQITIFLILEFKIKIRKIISKNNFSFPLLKEMIIYSAPLVVNSVAAWLLNGFGRIIIFDNLGAAANGLYTFANKFVTIITTVGSVVSMAILEEAMITLKTGEFGKEYPPVLETVFRLFLSIIIVAMPAVAIFYSFISSTEYYSSLDMLPFLFIYSVLLTMSINFGVIFKTINKNKYQVTTTILSSVVMLSFSYIFLDLLGIYAVAIGQMLGSLAMLVSRYLITKRFLDYKIKWSPIFILTVIFIGISILSITLPIKIVILIFIISTVFVIIINREFIKMLFKRG